MPATNTQATYGSVTKTFHWLTALLILTLIPLGWYANRLPFDTGEALAYKAQLFSYHKTLGVAAFFVALLRILWALTQPKPAPMHPERRAETLLADIAHWTLYIALVAVPLSGWIKHAATEGFAPILWPLGQSLPFVGTSESIAYLFGSLHWIFTKVLIAAILLHVAGALKHALIDRDQTLARILPGSPRLEPYPTSDGSESGTGFIVAATIYTLGFVLAVTGTAYATRDPNVVVPTMAHESQDHGHAAPAAMDHSNLAAAPVMDHSGHDMPAAETPAETPSPETAENTWTVTDGTLGITVRQLGSAVTGSFADWSAEITFDETASDGKHGTVTTQIAIPSLTMGSVTKEALAPDFFDAETHPTAIFTAEILRAETGYLAQGTLTLKGAEVPLQLPFTLQIDGDTATMTGTAQLDRRDFGIGESYSDESAIGFGVQADITLTAARAD